MTTKILLFGSNGQVGTELSTHLSKIGDLTLINRSIVDLTSQKDVRNCIRDCKPQFIVNAAAYTAVDKAESEPQLAQQINAIAPQIIAEESNKINAQFIHISTDYVFDGKSNIPYLESDNTNPLGVYGKSKLQGEENIKENSDNYIILRTAWVYGKYGKGNFLKTMLRVGEERDILKVVIDQIGCPTYAEDIAIIIKKIIEQNKGEKYRQDIYHFTNLGVCSWYDFAVNIFRQARKLNYPLKVKEIIPISTAEYPTPAQRPAYSVLNTRKIRNNYNINGDYWLESLERYFQ
ncbi:dTDP-4-dehydrorhamnose reductase [Cyanobacterium aponinum AL20118]|uniref:dTDP-4-dehydrorhamnose reductase n=1 Tax=Cyanobacterium aponinum AL20115 TaxID=3090662 RepID=A0AAF0ZH99_9CHRO|nr:dTDP-4-dehydrorhamnose reductase [Cyanobacterium aponinum]WPF90192.1 dTDP-4-dehydrorhamnose reductase [Cyanobacterium aponinum AL20115]